jgi:hypothetical protein
MKPSGSVKTTLNARAPRCASNREGKWTTCGTVARLNGRLQTASHIEARRVR